MAMFAAAMTDWEPTRFPPRTSSRWPAPGLFVNVEIGVTIRPEDRTHTAQMKYTSRRMEERLQHERVRQQQEQALFYAQQQQERYQLQCQVQEQQQQLQKQQQGHQLQAAGEQQHHEVEVSRHPSILMPARGDSERQARLYQQQDRTAERQRALGVSMREQHERGTSAPPTVADRTQPISPISPVSPIILSPMEHTSDMPVESIFLSPLLHTTSLPLETDTYFNRTFPTPPRIAPATRARLVIPEERINQELPPTPSHFRLGEADLPWSVPAWYRTPEPEQARVASPGTEQIHGTERVEQAEPRRLDDPQRVRDLSTLHQAMMTVDTLSAEGWEPASWEGLGALPSGPRSIGWAVSSEDASASLRPTVASPGPPPYVVSQWEERFGRSRYRPRSSYR